MFKRIRKNNFACFSIVIEDILKPFWDLAILLLDEQTVLGKAIPDFLERIKDVFKTPKTEVTQARIDDIMESGFNDYVQKSAESIIDGDILSKKGKMFPLLAIFKDPINKSFCYFSENEKDDSVDVNLLKSYLIQKKFIASFLEQMNNKNLEKMKTVDMPSLYANVLQIEENLPIELPLIPISYLNIETLGDIEEEEPEEELLWLNADRIHNYFPEFPTEPKKVNVWYDETRILGLKVDDYFFPTFPVLQKAILAKEHIFDYIWLCLKHKVIYEISHDEKKGKYNGNELLETFMMSCKNDVFIKELSKLQDNLFIAKEDISEEGQQYFDKMLKIEKLDNLKSYKFYIDEPQTENKNVFGIYQNVKLDEDYHLKFLFENKGDKLADKKIKSLKKEFVWVLKPKIAQFFLSDFYEQLLYSSLKELKDAKVIEDYLTNYFAVYSDDKKCEIDAIVKTKDKIFFVEAKTTLTLNLINKYITKCQKIINDFDEIKDHIGFLIVGYFSHPELNVLKRTVPQDEIPEGYNEERDGLANTPYYFEVPIGENLDHKLICFTELSYSKLEETLKSVFK